MVFVVGSLLLMGGMVMLVDEYVGKDDVVFRWGTVVWGGVVFKEGNFSVFTEGKKYVVVKFYVPWCGHYKAMALEYAVAATEIHLQWVNIISKRVGAYKTGDEGRAETEMNEAVKNPPRVKIRIKRSSRRPEVNQVTKVSNSDQEREKERHKGYDQ
ncbi:hypothetical protein RJ640_007019 [Escallonia rubra]|uniref:Thioredoxin domain-containing protein n=1 Tax=Escallonia rubra TaxID=112253 RepID=A0AA88R2Q5_9ASTE|nr:hypothetical protein RJ640_007019 [Escallonia rubra]